MRMQWRKEHLQHRRVTVIFRAPKFKENCIKQVTQHTALLQKIQGNASGDYHSSHLWQTPHSLPSDMSSIPGFFRFGGLTCDCLCWWKIRVSWWQVFQHSAGPQPSCLECTEATHYGYGIASGEAGQGRTGGGGKSVGRKLHCSTGVASFALLLGTALHVGLLAKPLQSCWDCPASSGGRGPWGYSTLKKGRCCPSACSSLADKSRHPADLH